MTDLAEQLAEGGPPSRRSVYDVIFASGPYQASLKSRVPKRLALDPLDIFPGSSDVAENIFQGQFVFGGHELNQENKDPWLASEMPLAWHKELHGFTWLRHFAANDTQAARHHARALITLWVRYFGNYRPYAWDDEVLSRRLIEWFCHGAFLLEEGESEFNYLFLKSLRRQYIHLSRIIRRNPKEEDRVQHWQALLYGALCFSDLNRYTDKTLGSLEKEIQRVVMADGCHISRNPERHLELLGDLIGLRNSLMQANQNVPIAVNNAIDRLAPAVRFFQHGDGRLALFNGGSQTEDGYSDTILSVSDATGRPPHRFPKGGFERLKAGRALLITETGEGGREKKDTRHAGLLSFEFSYGRERLIVNCGSVPDAGSSWGRALAATAAHSTLGFESLNAVFSEKEEHSEDQSTVVRNEEDGNIWLDLESHGYQKSIGILHRRRLFLDASGRALRGEDQIIPQRPPTANKSVFSLRFHLHPDLSISRSAGGKNILIRTASGVGWKFLTGAPRLTLEESVYCGSPGERRRNQQVVITGHLSSQDPVLVKWALTRLSD